MVYLILSNYFVLFIKEIFIACDTSGIKQTNYHLLRFCNQVLVVSDSLGVLLIENHDISGNLVRSMSKFSKLLTYERKKMNKNTCFCIVLFLLVEINWRGRRSQVIVSLGTPDVAGSVLRIRVNLSFQPSIGRSGSFLGIYTLVFSGLWYGVMRPCEVLHDKVECFRKIAFGRKWS